jgi:hypothetical protein
MTFRKLHHSLLQLLPTSVADGLVLWGRRLLSPYMGVAATTLGVFWWLTLQFPGNANFETMKVPEVFRIYSELWAKLESGGNPYVLSGYSSFNFSPAFLAFISALPKSPQDAWFWFSLLSISLFSVSLFTGARYRSWKDVVFLLAGVALSWRGVLEALQFGQVELILFFILITASSLFSRWPFFTGCLLGLLPWIKAPYGLLMIPFILAANRREVFGDPRPTLPRLKLLFSGIVFSSVFWGAAVPSMMFGPDRALALSIDWAKMMKLQPTQFFSVGPNQSLWIAVDRWFNLRGPAEFGVGAILGGWLLGVLLMRRPSSPAAQDSFIWITPWLILNQLLNPLAWRWGSVFLVGSFFSASRPNRPTLGFVRVLLWLTIFVLFLLQQNFFVRPWLGLQTWTELHDLGTVTLYWLLLFVVTL